MNIMKKIKNKRYLIPSLIIVLLIITLGSIFSYGSYFKIGFSLEFFINSCVTYFQSLLRIETNDVYTTFDLIKDVNMGVVDSSPVISTIPLFALPFNLDNLVLYLKEGFFMAFDYYSFINYFSGFINVFSYLNFIVLILIFLIALKVFISSISFNEVDPVKIGYTKKYKGFENFIYKVFHPIYIYLKNFYKYIKEKKILSLIIVLLLVYSNCISIIFDLFAYFFYFSSSFDLMLILEALVSSVYLLFPIISQINLFGWIVIFYLIFDYIRRKRALNLLISLESSNLKFCDTKLGLVNLFDGLMGGFKTSTITDFALTTSKLFRYSINDNLYKYRSMLPYFNFSYLEKYVERLALENIVYNHAQLEYLLELRFKIANTSLTSYKSYYYFSYDFKKYKDYYWDGTKKITLDYILIEYAKNYFYYFTQNNYIYSNYPIKTIEAVINRGYYPEYSCHYFFIKEEEYDLTARFSHCINLNEIRIKKYFNDLNNFNFNKKDKDLSPLFSFGVVAYAEAEKDLGNQNTNKIYDLKDLNANPLNDGTDLILKMVRHVCNLNFKPYIKFFLDMQRFGDLASKYKDISTSLIRAVNVQDKLALRLWTLEGIFCRFVIRKRKEIDHLMKTTRNRFGFLYYFFNKCTYFIENYYNKNINKYSYKKLTLLVKGREEDEGEEYSYFLINAKIFADSYRTDSHYSLFKSVLKKSKKGVYSNDLYSGLNATVREMNSQHSYFNDRLERLFEDNFKADKGDDTYE